METPAVGSQSVRVQYADAGNSNADMSLSQKAPKNGWAFVFISNESNEPVLFDDLLVTQEHGRISEENHYYPFGLKIAGISSRSVNKLENKYGYQGDFAEFDEETGWDDFELRSYDAQIGRWTGMDPYDEFASGYLGMANDPVNIVDPNGGTTGAWGAVFGAVIGAATPHLMDLLDKGKEYKNKGYWGALGALVGAGLGYGIDASLAGEGPLAMNTKAFYIGLLGGHGYVYGKHSVLNDGWAYVDVPIIWQKIVIPKISFANPFRWVDATKVMIKETLLASIRLGQIKNNPNVADGYPSYGANIALPPNDGNLSVIINGGISSLYNLKYSGATQGSRNIIVEITPDVSQIINNKVESFRQRDQSGQNLEEIRRMRIRDEIQQNNLSRIMVFEKKKEFKQFKYLKILGINFFKLIRKKP